MFDTEYWADERVLSLPVKAGAVIRQGALVMVSGGYAEEAGPGTGKIALGVAQESVDNTGGADGAKKVLVRRGVFRFENDPADPVGPTELGKDVYATGPNTVAKTGTGRSKAGRLLRLDPDGVGVWVEVW
ncbi:capsid cement protein [Thermus hydrothermalis]|uniref:capsid cement protein n=1 Tax=Thermus hydrothermalis TaxID=2908148 RepID=UPI001FA9F069|nr:capsid cement protein [Thermus hydrothermalis]